MLEHVREHAELVGALASGQVQPVIELHTVDLGALAGDLDGRLGDLHTGQRSAEAAAVQLAQQRAVAAADLERAGWPQARLRAQGDHVVGLADGAKCPPARVACGVGWRARVGVVVKAN